MRPHALLAAALALSSCAGDPSGDSTSATAGTASTSTTPGSTSAGSTSADETTSAMTTSAATTSATTTASTTTTSDTTTTAATTTDPTNDPTGGGPGFTCPLAAQDGIGELVLAPLLFGDGDDPSAAPSCAFKNPERGFHGYVDLRTVDGDTLDEALAAGRTVIYGQVLIPEFRDKALDAALLAEVDAAFTLVRGRGMKVVPRFHYSNDIDEPDATLARILGHIDQLAPLLKTHADVILTLQAGFIGAWGEWHSSQNGLDAPGPRNQVMDALLNALPPERTITVRRPSFKQDAYGGPLTEATAHDGSARARVGHVNDCFLASDDDYGTYQAPGEKDYAIADSRYVPVGGETCAVNPPRSECPSALAELALLHWTHLNSAYHPDVLESWQADGCYAEIACRLGYRLAVEALRWVEVAGPGEVIPVHFEVVNDGFAAPVNPRPLVLVLDGPVRVEASADFDLRDAAPGELQMICVEVMIPVDAPAGSYRIGLRLADPAPTLADDPRQAIRLGQDEGVEWSEGVNWFDAAVSVR